jgi:HK97 family phage portal protein
MSFLSRLFGGRQEAVAPRNEPTISSAEVRRGDFVWSAFTGGGSAPSESSAMAVTAVSACVELIAGSISSLPMHTYKRDKTGDLTRDHESDIWWVLNEQFHPRWSASTGWNYLVASRLLRGDAFAKIERDSFGRIKALIPIHPNRVDVVAAPDGARLVYLVQPDQTLATVKGAVQVAEVLDQEDMLHVPGFGFDGLRGMSMLRYSLRNSGTLAISAQDFSKGFLQNLGRPDFALQTDQSLTDDQFAALRDTLDGYRGPANAGRAMILEAGLKLSPITMPLEEMQLLETRKFQVEEIARAFCVPPFMIGHTEKTSSWGTGVEAMGAGFVRYTLRNHLNAFQNEINRKFYRRSDKVAEFDTTELERGDTKAMFEAVRIALGRAGEPSFVTVEEGRHMLRLPREMKGTLPTALPQDPATQGNPA